MKKTLLLIILLFIGFSTSIFAQTNTTKRIHLNNGSFVNLPISVIDKAEVVTFDGSKQLKITQESGFVLHYPVKDIDSITHQAVNAINPELLGELRPTSVMGIVYGETGTPISFATVSSGFSNHQTQTDVNGVFFLDNILAYEKLGFIKVEKQGYFSGSRSFLPLDEGRSMLRVQLLTRSSVGSFNSASGGNVSTTNLQMNFPANAFTKNGQPYSGTVRVFAKALNPSDEKMFDQMPGDLLGGINNELQMLRSFGMAAIEITDNNNEKLELQNGSEATLKFTVPQSMLAEAPTEIEFWSFDEGQGFWKYESMAQLEGNTYTAQASHFSWWNCDVPENFVELKGVVRDENGNPISNARIEVITETFGKGILYSNELGEFSGMIPRNQEIILHVQLICESTNTWINVFNQNIESLNNNYQINISGSLTDRYLLKGKLLNCEGVAVEIGYVRLSGGSIQFLNEGHFSFTVCATGSYSLRGFDTDNEGILVSELVTIELGAQGVDMGEITVCESLNGLVIDIDGNVYNTIKIGTQEWMAENLKTTRYANGTEIPDVTDFNIWFQGAISNASCFYENNSDNGLVYGKLYNWFAVVDSRNICPDNWHVPSDNEWMQLEVSLGMNPEEAIQIGIRGELLNIGEQLKSWNLWQTQNNMNTNRSEFSGLPGGCLNAFGQFLDLGLKGYWWSTTESINDSAWIRTLDNNEGGIIRLYNPKRRGYSVRCVKD
jgi:uncharacterized protein (TIGR02145 family)